MWESGFTRMRSPTERNREGWPDVARAARGVAAQCTTEPRIGCERLKKGSQIVPRRGEAPARGWGILNPHREIVTANGSRDEALRLERFRG